MYYLNLTGNIVSPQILNNAFVLCTTITEIPVIKKTKIRLFRNLRFFSDVNSYTWNIKDFGNHVRLFTTCLYTTIALMIIFSNTRVIRIWSLQSNEKRELSFHYQRFIDDRFI